MFVCLFSFTPQQHFDKRGSEFIDWTPGDWKESPAYLNKIKDSNFRWFANKLNELWKKLGRKMKSEITVSVLVVYKYISVYVCVDMSVW